MKAKFLKLTDPLLRKTASEISQNQINSSDTKKVIATMLKVAHGKQEEQDKPIMVGLAAPQIGISKRIILVDIKADGKGKVGDLRIYLNPKITWKSKRAGEWYEGCYSTGKICGIVSRPTSIKIQAFTLKSLGVNTNPPPRWDFVEEKWTGYVARIFQHEIDHLDGKLFMDHIQNPNHLHLVEKHEFPLYRNKQAWRHWPKKFTYTRIQSEKIN